MAESKTVYSYEEALEASRAYFNCDPNDPNDNLPAKVFLDKYALQDNDGNLLEKTPEQMHRRIAREFARVEKKKFKKPMTEEEIFALIDRFGKIIPQGSPMYGIGNKHQTISLSNCFVIGAPLDSYGSILQGDEMLAQISKRRGGNGVDIENIRPAGTITHNAARTATGTIPFCSRYSNTIREVGQNGRRGALMISQNVHHPESVIPWDHEVDGVEFETEINDKGGMGQFKISSRYFNPKKLDFATMKYDKTKVTGANVSIRVTDEFLNAVEKGEKYQQRWPVDNRVNPRFSKMVDATAVWDKIIYSAWRTAEPGVLFWDNIIRESLADCYAKAGFKTVSTNPCFPASELLLTDNGYVSFGELFASQAAPFVVCDARVSYNGNEQESPEDWSIDTEAKGTIIRRARPVRMTQPMAKILRVRTSLGMEVTCTPDHHFATTDGMVEAQFLTPDHDILVSVPNPNGAVSGKNPSTNDEKLCFLMGLIAGDGTFEKERHRVFIDLWGSDAERMGNIVTRLLDDLHESIGVLKNSKNRELSSYFVSRDGNRQKVRVGSAWLARVLDERFAFNADTKQIVPSFVMRNARSDAARFYLAGLFYTDGDCGGSERSGYSVRLSQSNAEMLRQVQLVSHANGVLFGLYHRRDARTVTMPGGVYQTKDQYQLISVGGSWKRFGQIIGFAGHPNDAKLASFPRDPRERSGYYAKVVEITPSGEQPVFCLEEPVSKSIIVSGLTTRRCGEIPLSAYDSCRLLLLNLFQFVVNPFTPDAYFDFEAFYEHAKIAQRLMDDLVDLEEECILEIIAKVQNDPEPDDVKRREIELWQNILKACRDGRRTGTGITALGDTLAALGIGYGTAEGVKMTERIYKTLKYGSYVSSMEMAKELGPFPVWNHELEKDNPFLNRFRGDRLDLGSSNISAACERKYVSGDWLWDEMKAHGRRNIANLTTAPAGSVSIATRLIEYYGSSSGIEPEFDITPYTRKKKGNPGDKNFRVDSVDQNGDHWMHFTVAPAAVKDWMKVTGETDLTKSPWHKQCAVDLDWTVRVELQAAAQKHVDHSISSTVNLPADVTAEKVKEIYVAAWKAGCKGITVYRDGCRTGVLVREDKKEAPVASPAGIPKTTAPKRPQTIPCDVYHIKVKGTEYFVLVGLFAESGEPYEIFAGKNGMIAKGVKTGTLTKMARGKYKAVFDDGSELASVAEYLNDEQEAITRMASMGLRHGADIQYVVHQLEKTKGDLTSFARAMARALKKYIPDGVTVSGEVCAQCGLETIIRQEGCLTCKNCSYSKCG